MIIKEQIDSINIPNDLGINKDNQPDNYYYELNEVMRNNISKKSDTNFSNIVYSNSIEGMILDEDLFELDSYYGSETLIKIIYELYNNEFGIDTSELFDYFCFSDYFDGNETINFYNNIYNFIINHYINEEDFLKDLEIRIMKRNNNIIKEKIQKNMDIEHSLSKINKPNSK